jgi:hypothetical protein
MVRVRLYDEDAPEGEEMSDDFEMSALPDAGDRIAILAGEGEPAFYMVHGRTFEVAFDQEGRALGETMVTLHVERVELMPDDEDENEDEGELGQSH